MGAGIELKSSCSLDKCFFHSDFWPSSDSGPVHQEKHKDPEAGISHPHQLFRSVASSGAIMPGLLVNLEWPSQEGNFLNSTQNFALLVMRLL